MVNGKLRKLVLNRVPPEKAAFFVTTMTWILLNFLNCEGKFFMKNESMADKAYLELRRKILTNQVRPNARLKEELWAQKLQLSRMSVREALNRLLGEGLVINGEKGGYFLRSMNESDIHQLRELRELLEIGAFKLLCNKIKKPQITSLEKLCDAFRNMAIEGYVAGACEADIKFHESLIEFTGNEKLISAYQASHIPQRLPEQS